MDNNSAIPKKYSWLNFINGLKSYFNLSNDLETQTDVETSIRSGVSFKGSQLIILIFAIFIASLGLNTNSIPVIIGAMLISPLMGPIFGMGLALGIQDFALLRRGLKNIGMAILGSLVASAIYFLISPQYEGASQLLARTSPSIYDVFVGLFGGAAGIISIACKNKGQVMPGVAIATSLMPPLCTAGYGLATMQMHFFLGALYLFFTNMIFILFATWIGIKLMRFNPVDHEDSIRYKRVRFVVYFIVCCTIGVSVWLTISMIRKNVFLAQASDFVQKEMVFPNTQVLSHQEYIQKGKRFIDVTLIGESLPKDSLQLAMLNKLDSVGLGGTVLNIRQGFSLNSSVVDKDQDFDQFYSIMQSEIALRQMTIDSLKNIIALNNYFSNESARISPEIKVLFPSIRDLALSKMVVAQTDVGATDTVSVAFVNAPTGLSSSEREKLKEYLKVRFNQDNINLTLNPVNFPWPSENRESEENEQRP